MIWVIDCNDGASLSNFDESVAGKLVSVEPVKPLNMSHGHPRYCHYKPAGKRRGQGDCFECSRTSGQTSDLCIASWQITQILWLCGPMILPENGLSSKELLSRVSQLVGLVLGKGLACAAGEDCCSGKSLGFCLIAFMKFSIRAPIEA